MNIKNNNLTKVNDKQSFILSATQFFRLGGCQRTLLDSLGAIGPCQLQVRNAGGGIDRKVDSISMVINEEENVAFDAQNGLTMSLDQWIATHATSATVANALVPTLDFEFACRTAGVCLAETPKASNPGFVDRYVQQFGGLAITADELDEWRNEICPPFTMCSKCFQSAQRRANQPHQHPLYGILSHLAFLKKPFHCRLFGDHADMSLWINPQRISSLNGFLLVMDEDKDISLHIETAMAHAFRIQQTTSDGEKWASVQIHDSHGKMNFQISVDEPAIISSWKWICESMKTTFSNTPNPPSD